MTAYSEWYDNPGGYSTQFINQLYSTSEKYTSLIHSEATKAIQMMANNPLFSYEAPAEVVKQLPIVPMGEFLGGRVDETALIRFEAWVEETIAEMNQQ